jgi:hypothetical protein
MKPRHLLITTILSSCIWCSGDSPAQAATVTFTLVATFDYPAQSQNGYGTMPMGINDRGDIVGQFYGFDTGHHGFVRQANGNFSALLAAPNDQSNSTVFTGINDSSFICGYYRNAANQFSAFTFSQGVFTNFTIPGATATSLLGVNNAGHLSGATFSSSYVGFISIGGTVTTYAVPTYDAQTYGGGLNDHDQCAGFYNGLGGFYGYLRDADGQFVKHLEVGHSDNTRVYGINDRALMVGSAQNHTVTHAAVFLPAKEYFIYDYPGAAATVFTGINKHNLICGFYVDGNGFHGLLVRAQMGDDN